MGTPGSKRAKDSNNVGRSTFELGTATTAWLQRLHINVAGHLVGNSADFSVAQDASGAGDEWLVLCDRHGLRSRGLRLQHVFLAESSGKAEVEETPGHGQHAEYGHGCAGTECSLQERCDEVANG